MITIKKGNILDCTENIIVHQVNSQGVMGGGLARQLADKYKGLEPFYFEHCREKNNSYQILSGTVLFYGDVNNRRKIANIFSQKENFNTDYKAMKIALKEVKQYAKDIKLSIAIPYGIGCGIANGNWDKVYKIIEQVFSDYKVILYKLED